MKRDLLFEYFPYCAGTKFNNRFGDEFTAIAQILLKIILRNSIDRLEYLVKFFPTLHHNIRRVSHTRRNIFPT